MHTCEPNTCICGWNCEHMLRCLQTVRIPFATNQNLLVFMSENKGNCTYHIDRFILCSPQVCRKLIYHTPSVNCLQTIHKPFGSHVCTSLKHAVCCWYQNSCNWHKRIRGGWQNAVFINNSATKLGVTQIKNFENTIQMHSKSGVGNGLNSLSPWGRHATTSNSIN